MRVVSHATGAAMVAAARGFFEATEVTNNLMVSVLSRSRAPVEGMWLTTLEDDGGAVVGAAMHTPAFPFQLTTMPEAALDALVAALVEAGRVLPGVGGEGAVVDAFLARWAERGRGHETGRMAQGLYRLTTVTMPSGVAGAMRVAGDEDVSLVTAWTLDFARDVLLARSEWDALAAMAPGNVAAGRVFLWTRDGAPVCMVVRSGDTFSYGRVGNVYTPSEHRGHGYASALTGLVSQRILDEGKAGCLLYTDLANPTSNKLYQRLGYTFVESRVMVHLDG